MTAVAAELARHVDPDGTAHRLLLITPDKLRCLDCQRTIDLRPLLAAVPGSTSTSRGIPHPDQSCPQHPGEWPDTCGRCRSERLEGRAPRTAPAPTSDVGSGVAACRAAVRTTVRPSGRTPSVDPEAMARARAELAAREPVPTPDVTPNADTRQEQDA